MLGGLGFGVHIILGIVFYLLWLRIVFHFFQIPVHQPVFQWILRWTDYGLHPVTSWLQRFQWKRVDLAALSVWFVLAIFQYYILSWMRYGFSFHFLIVLISILGDGIYLIIQILFYAMVLRFLMHYIEKLKQAVFSDIVMPMTDPFIHYTQDLFPTTGKFDLAPVVWMVMLKIVGFVVYASMPLHL